VTTHAESLGNSASELGAVCAIARLHGIAASASALHHELAIQAGETVTYELMIRAAKALGMKAKVIRTSEARLQFLPLPALAFVRVNESPSVHPTALLLHQCDGKNVLVQDPTAGAPAKVQSLEDFCATWTGELMLFSSRASLAKELAKFDFTWFLPSIVKYRRFLGEVLLMSLFIQLFALVSPLFFQVIMDKVLVHHGLATLDVLIIGIVAVILFETVLTGLRGYLLSHTTSRIDVELGSRLFRHLLQLPLGYFQSRRVGDSLARMREMESIRNFLTGSALTVGLDVVFTAVFVGAMLLYSVPLALIVMASLPCYIAFTLAIMPELRRRLNQKFARGAENQAMLVETVTAIQTVKASALEPSFSRRWDDLLASYVSATFRTANLATWAREGINVIAKVVNAITLWYGAHLVMENKLTVGEFIAFNMIAQRVAQPIMRLAQMWTEFQQVGISMARLGDILNVQPDVPGTTKAQMPSVRGQVVLDGVTFRYRPDVPPVIRGVSLTVKPGEVVGIVGRSGSGKSTLTKLIQRLYVPQEGRIFIDGVDLSLVDTGGLRRQVGVVLQENLLFNRSVRENIAIADPAAPLERVIQAAQLAGAHDFICEMTSGYETVIGEQGASLSGGQRQRLAIARALFTQPRILIFDEATSALDYESESIVQRNMAAICQGRTVFIIAHRLTAVRHANRIIVMDKGQAVEEGSHDALIAQNGIYARLWAMQSSGHSKEFDAAAPVRDAVSA